MRKGYEQKLSTVRIRRKYQAELRVELKSPLV